MGGLRARLLLMRQDDAAEKIQYSWKAWCWNRRCQKFLRSTVVAQRMWLGAVQRKWIRDCIKAATTIQKYYRRFLVRCSLDRNGRELARKQQAELRSLMQRKSEMSESEYHARTFVLSAKTRLAMAKYRDRNVEVLRVASYTLKSKHTRMMAKQKQLKLKGAVQPVRESIFEPMVYAYKRVERVAIVAQNPDLIRKTKRLGAPQSRVLLELANAHRALDRSYPRETPAAQKKARVRQTRVHAAARRGHLALSAKRCAKIPKEIRQLGDVVDNSSMQAWMGRQFATSKQS